MGGGVSGIEMALWDLAGKAYSVPVYQMLGGKYRDSIRIYADTPASTDAAVYATRMKSRIDKGFTFLKISCLLTFPLELLFSARYYVYISLYFMIYFSVSFIV